MAAAAPADTPTDPLPMEKVKSAGSEYGFPHGHLGRLNDHEQEAFEKFKVFVQEKGLYRPGPPPSHDDPTLLRYLRARRWVVEDAYGQFKATEEWRAANHLDVLYATIDVEAYEHSRRMYPQWTGRRDKRGLPLYVFEIRHLDSKTVHKYEKEANATYSRAHSDGKTSPRLLRLFALYENLTRFVQPLCTEMNDRDNAQVPITQGTNIVDVSGVSLRQFWNLKSHMQAASTLATAHYPETLDRIFIIGAPFFFSTVWGWIKRWFDPITVSKIHILAHHEVLPTLTSYMDKSAIPKPYGGELEWKWGEMPSLDPAIAAKLTWEGEFKAIPKGPVFWQPIEGNRLECLSVGSVKQVEKVDRVCTLARSYEGVLAALPDTSREADEKANAEPTVVAQEKVEAQKPVAPAAAGTTSASDTAKENRKPGMVEIEGVKDLAISGKEPEVSEKTTPPEEAPVAQTSVA